MKSVKAKAKEYLESLPRDALSCYIGMPKVVIAVSLAEQEAEERMRAKAISAFDDMWFENGEDGEFEPDYEYHRRNFIQKLNEDEND
jgi:hypothetical protein